MSKKRSSKKQKPVKVRIEVVQSTGFPEVPDFDAEDQAERKDRFIQSFIPAEPGWHAIYHSCPEHGVEEDHELPVIFWVLNRWESSNQSDICGLVLGPGGSLYEAPTDHHFVGYAKPGQTAADIIEHYTS